MPSARSLVWMAAVALGVQVLVARTGLQSKVAGS